MTNIDQTAWLETSATITTCNYQFARLSTLTVGIPTTRRFRLTFDYYAHGRRYSGEFQSSKAIAQDQRIPVLYNPLHPEQNSLAGNGIGGANANPLVIFSVIGSILLSLLWLALLHGCN